MARLSWPGWLVAYRDRCHAPLIELRHGHNVSLTFTVYFYSFITPPLTTYAIGIVQMGHPRASVCLWGHLERHCTILNKLCACQRMRHRPSARPLYRFGRLAGHFSRLHLWNKWRYFKEADPYYSVTLTRSLGQRSRSASNSHGNLLNSTAPKPLKDTLL